MREIKFRCVNEETGQVFDGDYIEETDNIVVSLSYGELVAFSVTTAGDYIPLKLIEYTGLKDKNGVEIYEGDILQPSNNEKKFYSVVFRNGCFERKYKFIRKYQGEQWEEVSYLPVHADTFKVVGNIYENPELVAI